MALIDHIDPITRRIYLSVETVGASIHPIDIYKEVRTLRKNDETLRPFDMFLLAFGNVTKTTTSSTERYVETYLGTRIVPYDISHTLTITGTIITGDGASGVYCFDRSLLGVSTIVDINYIPPQVEVITVSVGSGLSAEQDETLSMTKYQNKAVFVNTENVTNGDGSALSPFNTVVDTIDFAEANAIQEIYTYAEFTIDRNVKNFTIVGVGTPVVGCGGHDLTGSEFRGVELRGTYLGAIKAEKCVLGDNFELNGGFKDCSVINHLTCIDGGNVTLFNCFANIANISETNLSLNGIGSSNISIVNFDGHLNVSDVNNTLDKVTISMKYNHLELYESCIDGNIHLAGEMSLTDNSGINCVVDKTALIITPTAIENAVATLDEMAGCG